MKERRVFLQKYNENIQLYLYKSFPLWQYCLSFWQVPVSIRSLIQPTNFFQTCGHFGARNWGTFREGFMCEVACTRMCSLVEICEIPSWKLQNLVTTVYQTISNVIQTPYTFNFFTLDGWLEKCPYLSILRKIHFPKISKHASLILICFHTQCIKQYFMNHYLHVW